MDAISKELQTLKNLGETPTTLPQRIQIIKDLKVFLSSHSIESSHHLQNTSSKLLEARPQRMHHCKRDLRVCLLSKCGRRSDRAVPEELPDSEILLPWAAWRHPWISEEKHSSGTLAPLPAFIEPNLWVPLWDWVYSHWGSQRPLHLCPCSNRDAPRRRQLLHGTCYQEDSAERRVQYFHWQASGHCPKRAHLIRRS